MNEQIKLIKTTSSKDLFEKLQKVQNDKAIRVVVIKCFDEKIFNDSANTVENLLELMNDFSIPIILNVKSYVSKIMFKIVLASHICIASENTLFHISDKKKMINQVGSKNAEKLTYVGNEIGAEIALDLGLINKIVDVTDLESEAIAMAETIAKLAPLAIKSCIKAVNQGLDLELAEGLQIETELFTKIFATEDMKEGTSAFLEKRKPIFGGK